jgi:phosphotransferase system enzyme I (PtsP)
MSPTSIGPVKAMLLELDAGKAGDLIREQLRRDGCCETLRPQLSAFAEEHGIPV